MKALKQCANGCGVPPCPPSLVICRECMDKIGATLKRLADGKDIPNTPITPPKQEVKS